MGWESMNRELDRIHHQEEKDEDPCQHYDKKCDNCGKCNECPEED